MNLYLGFGRKEAKGKQQYAEIYVWFADIHRICLAFLCFINNAVSPYKLLLSGKTAKFAANLLELVFFVSYLSFQ